MSTETHERYRPPRLSGVAMRVWPFSWYMDRREKRQCAKREAEDRLRADVKARIARAQAAGGDVGFIANVMELGGLPDHVDRLLRAKGY